jgi:hypothetical protein
VAKYFSSEIRFNMRTVVDSFPYHSKKVKDNKDNQDSIEVKIEQQLNMIMEAENQYTFNVDQQSITLLRRKLNKLCSKKELTLHDLKRYETKMDSVSIILFVTVNLVLTAFKLSPHIWGRKRGPFYGVVSPSKIGLIAPY